MKPTRNVPSCLHGTGIPPRTGSVPFLAALILSATVFATQVLGVTLKPGDIIVADYRAFQPAGDGLGRIVKVDPPTGVQTEITSGGSIVRPYRVAIDADRDIIVADLDAFAGTGGVVKMDPDTGAQTVISSGGSFDNPWAVAIDVSGGMIESDWSAFSAPGGLGGVVRVDPDFGAQVEIYSQGVFNDPVGLTVVPQSGTAGIPAVSVYGQFNVDNSHSYTRSRCAHRVNPIVCL